MLKYLPNINAPEDIRDLTREELNELCVELRSHIISTITEIQKAGANVKLSLSIFDRNEGGKEKIERLGINHYSIFTYDNRKEDLVY